MIYNTIFIVLAAAGVLDAGYLVWKHYFSKKPLVCPIGEDSHKCSTVTESRWSKIFFVRNDDLGLLYYLVLLVLGILMITMPDLNSTLYLFVFVMTLGGFLFSIFLVFVMQYLIKEFCFFCLISAIISTLLFVNSIALLLL